MSYLSFDSRGGYLACANAWKADYADLSARIREEKANAKASFPGWNSPEVKLYFNKVNDARHNLRLLKQDARELLEMRATMKSLAQDIYSKESTHV